MRSGPGTIFSTIFSSVLLTQDILGSSTDEDGDCGVHETGSGGAHGMQVDGVGIRDIVDVQGGAGGAGVEEGGGDTDMVDGRCTSDMTTRCTITAGIAMQLAAIRIHLHLLPLAVQPGFGTSSHSGDEAPSTFVFWNQQVSESVS